MMRVSYSAPATALLASLGRQRRGNSSIGIMSTSSCLYVGSSPIALSALLSDELDVLAGGGTAAPTAYLQGFQRSRAVFDSRSPLRHSRSFRSSSHRRRCRIARQTIRRDAVRRDARILPARYFLKTSGLDPQKDVQLVQIGNTADILAALVSGTVDAGSLTFPYNFSGEQTGVSTSWPTCRKAARATPPRLF